MRIGFIGDIHGDLEALEWALDALRDADRVVSLGDIVDGRHDAACVRLLQDRGIVVVQGNHDHWASRDGMGGHARYRGFRDWLGELPRTFEEDDWMACHSRFDTFGDDTHWEYLCSEAEVRRAFAQFSQRLVFCGHTHVAAVNVLQDDAVKYLGTPALRDVPKLAIEPGRRYVVNAGRPTECVVTYVRGDVEEIEFTFRDAAPPKPEPAVHPLLRWWRRR